MTGNIVGVDAADLPTTLSAAEVAELWGVAKWSIYVNADAGLLPVAPLRVGKSLRWPTMLVLRSLGLDADGDADPLISGQVESGSAQFSEGAEGSRHANVTPVGARRGRAG
ncbi:hypothetical protein ACQPX6_17590 [Actinomycetospora sp. CA-101289]|uniref:hypothetical protein n=1 Tax=Actinomycetospora sp. CA-101289 TaxID=3239893 RepID=UPI003D997653